MKMITVTLDEQAWQQVISILATAPAPWQITNPLIMAVGAQVKTGSEAPDGEPIRMPPAEFVPRDRQ